jgi:hypothetical protein
MTPYNPTSKNKPFPRKRIRAEVLAEITLVVILAACILMVAI